MTKDDKYSEATNYSSSGIHQVSPSAALSTRSSYNSIETAGSSTIPCYSSNSSKSSNLKHTEPGKSQMTVCGDDHFDFSAHNESDLALAALDDEHLVYQCDRLSGNANCKPHLDSPLSFSPEQDLFTDDTGIIVAKTYAESHESSLNDSLSEVFFRTVEKGTGNLQKNKKLESNVQTVEEFTKPQRLECEGSVVETANFTLTSSRKTGCHDHQTSSSVNNGLGLKQRFKQRLKTNAGINTVHKKVEDNLRKEGIAQAQLEASQIRKGGTSVDIGPFYGLPAEVERLLQASRGISKLYDWQEECLQLEPLKAGRNLIYSLPTSGGKTLVAEILIMRELLCHQRDALFVLPFVSIVQEKVQSIAEFAVQLGFIVEEYAGSKGRFPPVRRREKKSLYIATIEKAHSLVNSLIETERIGALGLIVVDE
ncbi:helicase POLQ-like protein, partial [Elysia marginata]